MKTKEIPAFIMLTAGLINCVISIYHRVSLFEFTKRLLIVLVVFYLFGLMVKLILDINFPPVEEEPTDEENEEGQEDDLSGEERESFMVEDGEEAVDEEQENE